MASEISSFVIAIKYGEFINHGLIKECEDCSDYSDELSCVNNSCEWGEEYGEKICKVQQGSNELFNVQSSGANIEVNEGSFINNGDIRTTYLYFSNLTP